MNIAVYCNQPVLAAGLHAIVAAADINISAVCHNLEALQEHLQRSRPDVVILEISGEITLDAIASLHAAAKNIPFVLWNKSASIEFISQTLAYNVHGVLNCGSTVEDHLDCLRAVADGATWMEHGLTEGLRNLRSVSLAPRQRQLMGLVARGLRNKEIAYEMGITEGTVKVYLSNLFVRTGTSDRLELALLALRTLAADPASSFEQASCHNESRALPYRISSSISVPLTARLAA